MRFVKESKRISAKKIGGDPYDVFDGVTLDQITAHDQYSEEQSASSEEIRKVIDDDETEFNYAVDLNSPNPDDQVRAL